MKLKMKALAAGVALALAGPASAALVGPTPNSDLILNVWDASNKYILDLGSVSNWATNAFDGSNLTMSAFSNTSHTFNTGTTFASLFGGDTAGQISWNVMGAMADQSFGVFNSILSTGTSAFGGTAAAADGGVFNTSTMAGLVNGTGTVVVNGNEYNVGTVGTLVGPASDKFFNQLTASTSTTAGNSLSFFSLLDDGSGGGGDPAVRQQFAGTFSLAQNGALTYTVGASTVPLPAAIWLFGSGLIGMVTVGRRRGSAA